MIRFDSVKTRFAFVATIYLMILCAMADASTIVAQDEPKSQNAPKIRESILETFFLKREGGDGEYVPYFGMSFEEFQEAYKIIKANKSTTTPIGFSIRSASAIAKVRDRVATLDVELVVSTNKTGSVLIPVGFSNAMLDSANSEIIRKEGKYFYPLESDEKLTNKKINFSIRQNVTRNSGRKVITLGFPSATFRSIQVHEMESSQVFSAPDSAITSFIEPQFENGSAIEIRNLPEACEISWLSAKSQIDRMSRASADNVKVDAKVLPDKIDYRLELDFSSEEDSRGFRIGLPLGASNVSIDSELATIEKSEETDADDWEVYSVRFARAKTRVSNLMISWQRDDVLSLTGFELFQIDSEGGSIDVSFEDDSEFEITNSIDLFGLQKNGGNRKMATFSDSDFFAEIIPLRKMGALDLSVDYRIEFDRNSTQLSLRIPRQLASQAGDKLRISLQGWELLPSQVAFDAATVVGDEVNFELARLAELESSLLVEFILRKSTESVESLMLPFVINVPVGLRKFELIPDEFQEIIFDPTSNSSFKLTTEGNSNAGNSTGDSALVESTTSRTPVALTCSDESIRKINLKVRQIKLINRTIQSFEIRDQRGSFYWTSVHEIQSNRDFQTLAFQVDSSFRPKFELDSKPVVAQKVKIDGGDFFMIRLSSRVMAARVTCVSELDGMIANDDFTVKVPRVLVPLASSVEPTVETREINGRSYVLAIAEKTLSVVTAPNRRIVPDNIWQPIQESTNSEVSMYRPSKATESIAFRRTNNNEDDLAVERIWCLTSLNSDFRRDRIVVKFQPKSSVIDWLLPENTKLESCLLNGDDVTSLYTIDKNRIRVTFDDYNRKNVIEFRLRYYSWNQRSSLRLNLPKTNRLLWSQSVFWSVQLPDNQFTLNTTNNLSAVYSLAWTGFFLRPKPSVSLNALERDSGAELTKATTGSENEYLFETFGISDGATVYVVSKRNLVFFFGLFFITLGCAFVSLSFLRRSFFLVIVAAGILILGIWYPLWFVQLLQIEIFIGFLICIGIVVSKFTNWINPSREETRIETNVPSIALAAPDSTMSRTRITADNASNVMDDHESENPR